MPSPFFPPGRSVPWQLPSELYLAHACLSAAPQLLRHHRLPAASPPPLPSPSAASLLRSASLGVELVASWRRRSHKLPHAVDTTGKLAEGILLDVSYAESASPLPTPCPDHLSSVYALALLRGVTGLTDAASQKHARASSVSAVAGSLGLPAYLSDMRHDIAHNELPALPALRLAALDLLAYLLRTYWEPRERGLREKEEGAAGPLRAYKAGSKGKGDGEALGALAAGCLAVQPALLSRAAVRFLALDEGGGGGRGALVPGNPRAYPEDGGGFEKARARYLPLVAAVAKGDGGFAPRLLKALVGEAGRVDKAEEGAGRSRRLFFLGAWVRHLLGRDFASGFFPAAAVDARGHNVREKPRSKWREEDRRFMKEPVYCEAMLYPLNLLVDWCDGREGGEGGMGEEMRGIVGLLRGVLEKAGKRQQILLGKKRRREEVAGEEGGGGGEMSLEEMERMMAEGGEEDEDEEDEADEADDAPWSIVAHTERFEVGAPLTLLQP